MAKSQRRKVPNPVVDKELAKLSTILSVQEPLGSSPFKTDKGSRGEKLSKPEEGAIKVAIEAGAASSK
jgi:hypothetical protein